MTKKLEFFYDYVSLYSYIGNHRLASLKNVDVVYRPFFLGAVMQATGNRPPATVPAIGSYMLKDANRWADKYGIPLNFNPVFPQNTVNALRCALFALHEGEFEKIHQPLFDAMWVHQINLSDKDQLAKVLSDAGVDGARYIEATGDQALKDELKANTDEAIARGVFGAPTMYLEGEMFFGNDRFDFIEDRLVI